MHEFQTHPVGNILGYGMSTANVLSPQQDKAGKLNAAIDRIDGVTQRLERLKQRISPPPTRDGCDEAITGVNSLADVLEHGEERIDGKVAECFQIIDQVESLLF